MSALRVTDERVRAAMAAVDRRDFLSPELRALANEDRPLDIGEGQTTSQPSLIAWTLEQLRLSPAARVLEVGTGCGYQTALLAHLCAEVYSIDIIAPLVRDAAARLERLGCRNVSLRTGDGYEGWPEAAPFDGIVVAAGARVVPPPLLAQLETGGNLLIPVGEPDETFLLRVSRTSSGTVTTERLLHVRFVPLTGASAEHDRR